MSLFQHVETREFQIGDPIFRIAVYANSSYTDTQDMGFFGQYYNGSNLCFTGLFRDASDSGKYKLFTGLQTLPLVSDTLGIIDTNDNNYTLADLDVQNFRAFGDVATNGDLIVNGSKAAFNVNIFNVEDNIITVGAESGATEDFGYVGMRSASNVSLHDTAKISNVVIHTNYTNGSTTLLINIAASGIDYFKGWIIVNSMDGINSAKIIESSSDSGNIHTLILSSGFASNLTAGSDTVSLYNKHHVGWIYDESEGTLHAMGFPRETNETKIDYISPVNGNLPDYINVSVNDLTIKGDLTLTSSISMRTKTINIDTTFTQSDIFDYDIIFINKESDGVYTLPQISSLAVPANTAYNISFINVNAGGISTIIGSGSDTIEGKPQIQLIKLYMKVVLFVSNQLSNVWLIKG